jgi:hypothetical protein
MVTDGTTGVTQRQYLGVRGGVEVREITIETATDNLSAANHDSPDGHLTGFERASCCP